MNKLTSYVVRDGCSRRILWGPDGNGRYRAKEYFEALDIRQRAKFEPAFTAMAETGKITNPEKFNFEGDGLFLADVLAEQVNLALPMKVICSSDCRGLCPHCGANLNNEECRCEKGGSDPRMAPLARLKQDWFKKQ